jgi:hypothetical protein
VSPALARRLTIPAQRTDGREEFVVARPAFLQAGAQPTPAPPPILSFSGDTFMDDFLALKNGAGVLPHAEAWRDWAEPPAAMVDPSGAALYPVSITRTPPGLSLAADTDADGVPSPAAGAPRWLRKLYLPLHLRFNVMAFDVACRSLGFPKLARRRVLGSGAVVRRLVRDDQHEVWEDWVSADGKLGLWLRLNGGLPADPAAIPAAAWLDPANPAVTREPTVRARLGLAANQPLPAALRSAPFSQAPPPGDGSPETACTIFGLIPVFSAEEQAPEEDPGLTTVQIAAALQAKAETALSGAWADDAGHRAKTIAALQNLLTSTVLPGAPSAFSETSARNVLHSYGLADFAIDAKLVEVAREALRRVAISVKAGAGQTQLPPTASNLWSSSGASDVSIALSGGGGLGAMNQALAQQPAQWNTLLRTRLNRTAQAVLLGPTPPGTPAAVRTEGRALLTLALMSLRRHRLALANAINPQVFGQAASPDLTVTQPLTAGGITYNMPAAMGGALAAEIEAVLGMDNARQPPDIAPAWPPVDTRVTNSQRPFNLHRATLPLEAAEAAIDAAGAAGGSAYEARIAALAAATAAEIGPYLNLRNGTVFALREAGVDLNEQPARGLLLFPGPSPVAADFAAVRTQVAQAYVASAQTAAAEAKALVAVPRPRFDADSLYAVWGWVRVAGRDDCEKDRVVWTARTEPFSVAEPTDVLGARPVNIQLPDIPRLLRDLPRVAKARARPFAGFGTPPNSGISVGPEMTGTSRAWGVAWICSFGIPVLTICAWVLFQIIFHILIMIPGFAWMLLLKFCVPVPVPKKSL